MVTLISWVKTDNDMCIYLRKTLSLSTYLQNMNVIVCSRSETDTRKETQKRETH